jgi:hypothetical protein
VRPFAAASFSLGKNIESIMRSGMNAVRSERRGESRDEIGCVGTNDQDIGVI